MPDTKRLFQYILILIFIAVYCAEIYCIFYINPNTCEDAYITYRYSRNLAEGLGPVFNPGEHVEGYSNFLWMASIAGAHKLGLDMTTFSRVVGVIFNTLTLLLVWYIPYRFFFIRGYAAFFSPLLYLLFLPLHYYATTGLETSAYTFFISWCVLSVLWAENRSLPYAVVCLIFLLIALTRPEGILFFAVYTMYLILRFLFKRESLTAYIPGIIIFVISYAAFILWRLSYYHLPFPNTYYAKVSFPFPIRTIFGLFMTKGFLTHYSYFVIFLLMLWKAGKIFAERRAVIPVIIFASVGFCFSICFAGFDWMPYFRYTIPIVPLVIILCQMVFYSLWQSISDHGYVKQKRIWGIITVFCFILAGEQFFSDLTFNLQMRDLNKFGFYNQKYFGDWVKQEIGDRYVICIGDVGRFAFFSEAKILDIFGLTSRQFAALRQKYGAPDIKLPFFSLSFSSYKEKERALLLYLKPDYVMLYNGRLKISDTYPGSAAGIVEQPDFKDHYEYLTSFNIIPQITSHSWPKSYNFIDILDLSSGLLAWISNGWGYDIYVRRDSSAKRFRLEFFPDDRIKNISVINPAFN